MAHKTKINGTSYNITSGKALIEGTSHKIKKGKTKVDNTYYDIFFGSWVEDESINDALEFISTEPFVLSATDDFTWNGTLEYYNGHKWKTWNVEPINAVLSNSGYCLYLRGTGNTNLTGSYSEQVKDETTGELIIVEHLHSLILNGNNIQCNGNIEYLLDYQTVKQNQHPAMIKGCFWGLFANCTSLITAPELPAVALAEACYRALFKGCTSLSAAPILPAETMVHQCYSYMFHGCTSLKEAPALPAPAVVNSCYSNMFYGCTSLEKAPRLPATSLGIYCYYKMFEGCNNLKEIPYLPATTLTNHCYNYMFYDAVRISPTNENDYTVEYIIPVTKEHIDTLADALPVSQMFVNTDGGYFEVGNLFLEDPSRGVGYLQEGMKIVGAPTT